MDIFVRRVGVGLTHTENLKIKKVKLARETGELETEGKNAFLIKILIYQITIQTVSLSRTVISCSRDLRAL